MLHGDLSNESPKRVIFLWEHALGLLPLEMARKESTACKAHRWGRAVDCWEVIEHSADIVYDLWDRYGFRCDCINTSRPQAFSDALQTRLDDGLVTLPVRSITSMSTAKLARTLVRMPDVHKIVFGNPQNMWTFGAKGVYIGTVRSTQDIAT